MMHKITELENNENDKDFIELEEIKENATNKKSEHYYWIGKDYCNTYNKDFQNIEEFSKGMKLL